MSKKLRNVVRKHGDWTIPVLTVETGVDMEEGILFALDTNGLAIVADQATSKHAIGITTKTSTEGFGEAFKLNGANILKKGEYIEVYTHALLYTDVDVSAGKVGDPVYLSEGGKITLTKPTTTGIVQVVGVLANVEKGIVRLAIMDKGTNAV